MGRKLISWGVRSKKLLMSQSPQFWRSVLSDEPGPSSWKGAPERVRAPSCPDPVAP
ncbi:unnamed protein product [Brassica napus]|nr:unnamed protein product [Brassica napus]